MSTTTTIGEYLTRRTGNRLPQYFAPKELTQRYAVGIELELEGVTIPPDLNSSMWSVVSDGSLRNNGTEIVCAKPLSGMLLEKGLDDLECSLMNLDYTLSERCSTHIHLDTTDMTVPQLVNFLVLSAIFENSLFTLFGAERRANTFCLSIDRGSSNFEHLCRLGAMPVPEQLFDIRWSKYAGISLNRMRDLGTVEFRMFHPITKKADYLRVLKFLFALKTEAMNMESIQEIITYKKANSLSDLFSRIFPDEAYTEAYEVDIENGIQLANDMITSIQLSQIIIDRTDHIHSEIDELQDQLSTLSGGV